MKRQIQLPEPRLIGVRAAAAYLGATIWAVRTLAWSGAVPALKIGNRMLFEKRDIDAYIEKQKAAGVAR